MPSFKDYIQSLFKLSGGQAYANGNLLQIEGTSGSYTAPSDGFVLLGASSVEGRSAFINAWETIPVSSYGSTECAARVAIPCAKGQLVKWSYGGKVDVHAFAPSKGAS